MALACSMAERSMLASTSSEIQPSAPSHAAGGAGGAAALITRLVRESCNAMVGDWDILAAARWNLRRPERESEGMEVLGSGCRPELRSGESEGMEVLGSSCRPE
eukprot:SAG31_NODE_497_length_14862_cov_6.951568_13_plen_104_part_00